VQFVQSVQRVQYVQFLQSVQFVQCLQSVQFPQFQQSLQLQQDVQSQQFSFSAISYLKLLNPSLSAGFRLSSSEGVKILLAIIPPFFLSPIFCHICYLEGMISIDG